MNHLLKLLKDNRGKGVFNAEKSDDKVTLFVYDVIVSDDYWGGIGAEAFVKELMAVDAKEIHLRINSPGGDVFAARAMAQAVKEHPARVVAHIDGYAASAASILAIAADETRISEGGFYMIHKAWTFAIGNSDDLIETASLLEKVDASIVSTYAAKSNQSEDQISEWMKAETWFTAQEAVDSGFADLIDEPAPKAMNWDLSAYGIEDKKEEQPPVEDEEELAAKNEDEPKAVADTECLRKKLSLRAA